MISFPWVYHRLFFLSITPGEVHHAFQRGKVSKLVKDYGVIFTAALIPKGKKRFNQAFVGKGVQTGFTKTADDIDKKMRHRLYLRKRESPKQFIIRGITQELVNVGKRIADKFWSNFRRKKPVFN
jgi:hypothetical protein